MNKVILLIVLVFCVSVSGFSQETKTWPLSDKIVKAIEQNLPGWTISQKPKLVNFGIGGQPAFELIIKDDQNRDARIEVSLVEDGKMKDERFRFFFIRQIMPSDSSKIDNFVEKGFLVGTANSVEAIFSKANLVFSIYSTFPAKQTKTPSYYLPAPKAEKDRLLKLIEILAQTIGGEANFDECQNTFFKYPLPPKASPEDRLLAAVASGDAIETAEILRQNVDPNIPLSKDFAAMFGSSGNTALHLAAKQGCVETAKALIAAKADVNAVNERGETPLMLAAYHNNAETVSFLISAKADLQAESYGRSAAFFAVRTNENLYVINALTIERQIQKMTENGREIIKALAAKGVDLKKKDSRNGNTLLTALFLTSRGKFGKELATLLIESGVDPNEPNDDGMTPLIILANAVSEDAAELMKLLVSKGADVNKRDKNGQSALNILLKNRGQFENNPDYSKIYGEAIDFLRSAGAK